MIRSDKDYYEIKAYALRRFLDLSFESICLCLKTCLKGRESSTLKILDVGAGRSPYRTLLGAASYSSLDPEEATSDYKSFGDIPSEESFNVFLLLETLEHVSEPDDLLREIASVMKRNAEGELWVSVPYGVRFHMRPKDYWRWTDEGLSLLLEKNGFVLIETPRERGGDLANLVARLNVFVFSRLKNPFFWPLALIYILAFLPLQLLAHADLRWNLGRKGDPLGLFVRCKRS